MKHKLKQMVTSFILFSSCLMESSFEDSIRCKLQKEVEQ